MKRTILLLVAGSAFVSNTAALAQSRYITLFTTNSTDYTYFTLNTNETGRAVDGWLDPGSSFAVSKDGFGIYGQSVPSPTTGARRTNLIPVTIAGPAFFALAAPYPGYSKSYCTIEVVPSAFPADKTLILPEGIVGVVHVESSTNLVQWQDEWVHIFANTNQNRFFRLRAERTLP